MLPRLRACIAPWGPHKTSSSAGGSLTMLRRKSEAAASSWGDFASPAPAATSSSARAGVRFHTVTGYPAFNRFMLMGRPIKPSPINPMAGFKEGLLRSGRREARRYSAQKEETIVAELPSGSSEQEACTDLRQSWGAGAEGGFRARHRRRHVLLR